MRRVLWRLPVFLLVGAVTPAQAANWEIQPRFRLAETWTDNYNLAADGEEEEEWITEIAPGLRISGEGRRADLDLVYRMQHLAHARESDRNRTNHLLNADGGIELVRERLFFNADASRSIGSGRGGLIGTDSNAIAADQRDTVTTWSAGPRLQYPFGSFAGLEAAYRRQYVDFGNRIDGDSEADITTLGLASGPMFTTWGWAIDYSRREESRTRDEDLADDDGFAEETKLERLRGELNLRAGASTQLFVAGGTEKNEFETAEAGEAIDGDFWEAGFRWNPSRLFQLEAAVGERFFGETARGSLTMRGSALSLQLGYSEDIVTRPQLEFERQQELLTDDEGNLVIVDGQPVFSVIAVPTVRDEVFIQERAFARLGWNRSHTSASLAFIATDREFQRSGTTEDTRQLDLNVAWSRLVRTTVTAGFSVQERTVDRNPGDDTTYVLRAGAVRELAPNADLDLEFEHVTREHVYHVNRVTLGLDLRF